MTAIEFGNRWAGACAAEMIAKSGEHAARTVAIEAGDASLNYGQLETRVAGLAGALRACGVGAGTLVAVCLPRSIDQLVALMAAWRAGAGYLPLDPAWPEARLTALVSDAGCAALIASSALGARIAGDTLLVDPAASGDSVAAAPVDPDALAYVIYTSGSTGKPKAVEVSHGNLSALIAWHVDAFAVHAGTRTSHLAGLGFDAAAWEAWPTLAVGGTLALVDDATRLDAARLRDWLIAERIEVAFAPTALAEPMVRMVWPADSALLILLTGADKLTVRPKAGLPFTFVNNYGPTESTVVATSGTVNPEDSDLPPIGRAIAGTVIHLLDDDRQAVADGTPGEIWIGGAQVARGYRGDPALTAERFVRHPEHGRLYRTGDLGVRSPNGEIAFRGRVDGQVKVRGHRIEPAEVAAALNRLADISTSAVVARDGELIAYVVPAADAALTASDLRGRLAETLPDYMVPARFATLAALPLTPNGKVDAKALPDPAACALTDGNAGAARAPSTPTEKRLLEIVSGVIGRSDIGVDDDFFLIGGHSLLGTQVVVRSRDAFGVELTLFHLFEGRTVATLATTIERLIIEKLDSMSEDDLRRMAAG